MTLLKHVDLCSGIGGFSLGFQWAQLSNPILFCDIEPWCRKILTQHWPDVPIYEDVKEIANDPKRFIPERPDILTAGYPCQPFSVAGRRRGEKDHRHIWPEIFSIIQSRRPTWTVFENVRGHITMGLDSVLADLEREGYSTRTFIVPAIGVDAPHKRDRVWIVSHIPDSERNGLFATSESRGSEETVRQESEGQRHALNSSGASGVSETEFAMADTEGNISDGIRRETEQESDRGNARMESECSRDRQFVSRPTSTVADSRCIDQGSEEKSEWTSGDSSGCSLGSDSRSESEDGISRTNLADTESQQGSSSNNRGEPREVSQSEQIQSGGSGGWSDVADTESIGVQGLWSSGEQVAHSHEGQTLSMCPSEGGRKGLWPTEPNVGRVADGIPNRVDRIKGLGNAIVPQIAYRIGLCIKEAETN